MILNSIYSKIYMSISITYMMITIALALSLVYFSFLKKVKPVKLCGSYRPFRFYNM